MRLTTKDSIMGRKHDIMRGCASVWKTKLKNYRYELIEEAVDKLGELEDIENEIEIDLITLFKALKDGIYVKVNREINFIRYVSIFKKRKWHLYSSSTFWGKYDIGLIKNYGKTWALTKEELQ